MDGDHMLVLTVGYLLLLAAPGIAAGLVAAVLGSRSTVCTAAVGLAASGLTAIVTFWAYFALHDLGLALSFLVPAASVATIVWVVLRRQDVFRESWRVVLSPWALWGLGTVFLLALGFLHGGEASSIATASVRFSHQLPSDNYLPLYFADGLFHAPSFRAPAAFADWISSDRPPLQVGYVVSARPFGWSSSGLEYQVLTVAAQQLWIVGAWALLASFTVRTRTRALAMAALLVSDVAILNGFYTWPKLIAVGFLLAAAAMVLSDWWIDAARRTSAGVLLGLLLGAAMLCHGATMYALIPLAVVAVVRRRPSMRFLGALVGVVVLCQVPWMAYQKYADPPGDRLERWMLAGDTSVSDESLVHAVVHAYTDSSLGDLVQFKIDNVDAITGGWQGVDDLGRAVRYVFDGEPGQAVKLVRDVRFYSLLQAVGLLLLGLVVMLVARLRRWTRHAAEWSLAVRSLVLASGGIVVWILVQYGNTPASTLLHTASLLFPMLLTVACVVGAAAVSTKFACALVAANWVIVLGLYVPYLDPPAGSTYSPLLAVVGVVALGLFVLLSLRAPIEPRPLPEPPVALVGPGAEVSDVSATTDGVAIPG